MGGITLKREEVHFKHGPIVTSSQKKKHHENKNTIVAKFDNLVSLGQAGYDYYKGKWWKAFEDVERLDKHANTIRAFFKEKLNNKSKEDKDINLMPGTQKLQEHFSIESLAKVKSFRNLLEGIIFNIKVPTKVVVNERKNFMNIIDAISKRRSIYTT